MARKKTIARGLLFDIGGTLLPEGSRELYPSVRDTLRKLCGHYRLGIITNTDYRDGRRIRLGLRRLGIERFFVSIVVSVDTGFQKPDPRIFEIALKDLGLRPGRVVMIGNRPEVDIKGAKTLGIKTVLLDWECTTSLDGLPSDQKPCRIIHSIEELFSILENWNCS